MKMIKTMLAVSALALGITFAQPKESSAMMYYGYVPSSFGETLEMAYWWYFER